MNFFFVDRILSIEPGKHAQGSKNVTANDIYVKNSALFSCVIGEALGQLCSWNVLKTTDFRYRPVGGLVEQIEMLGQAHIGDTIHLDSVIERLDTENHMVGFSGQASVNGKTILTIKNSIAPMLPLEDFNHLHIVKDHFQKLTSMSGLVYSDQPRNSYIVKYDKIISKQNETEIVAEKFLPKDEPYFIDHFPKKPVFPLSLLLEYNLQLAHEFITEIHPGKTYHPTLLRKIKIGSFIQPGDLITTSIKIKQILSDACIVQFRNDINEKKACIAEATFSCST